MPVVTVNGIFGSGTLEVGQIIAQQLNLNYVDRYVFAEAAKLVRSPIGNLIDKEQRVVRFRERLSRFLQTVLERSAVAGISGEPYFGRGIEMLPVEAYTELAGDSSSTEQSVNDEAFINATTAVIKDLASNGDVVIIGRGANIILADTPGVIHVGMVAPLDVRIETLVQREHFNRAEAREYVEKLETARLAFFRKFFKVDPNDPNLYHLVLNIGEYSHEVGADLAVHAIRSLSG